MLTLIANLGSVLLGVAPLAALAYVLSDQEYTK